MPYATRLRQQASPGLVPFRRSFSEAGNSAVRPARCCSLTEYRPANKPAAPDAAASTASQPAFVTTAKRPFPGRDVASDSADLPDGLSGIFFAEGLDRPNQFEMSAKISLRAHWIFDPIDGNHAPHLASVEILRTQFDWSAVRGAGEGREYAGRCALMKSTGPDHINSKWSADVRFGAHSGFKSDITALPKSAHERTSHSLSRTRELT